MVDLPGPETAISVCNKEKVLFMKRVYSGIAAGALFAALSFFSFALSAQDVEKVVFNQRSPTFCGRIFKQHPDASRTSSPTDCE